MTTASRFCLAKATLLLESFPLWYAVLNVVSESVFWLLKNDKSSVAELSLAFRFSRGP